MSAGITHPVVLDATVLSNFASTGTVSRLVEILDQPATVPAVRTELEQGFTEGYEFLDNALAHLGDAIEILDPVRGPVSGENEIRRRLDGGEAASLLAAMDHNGTLATDDLAARSVSTEHDIPVTGSVGLLVLGIRREVYDTSTANRWLHQWQTKRGYHAPVENIEDVLD